MQQIWLFIAGLGLFLLGMQLLENGIRELGGNSFRRFLRDYTDHPAQAILVGIAVTMILQSSSLVTLMLLALTGAGMIALRNALGVVIGANLGTTFTGWIVATLGFRLQIDTMALPLVGIGCIGFIFAESPRRAHHAFALLAGLGFLLLGLSNMKDSADQLPQLVDVSRLAGLGIFSFLLVGLLLTAVIQSSSATMMITLSALHAQIIELPQAAAMVIGADLGTTITTVLGALKGSAIKKRVALAHVLFNVVTDLTALLLLFPLLALLQHWVEIDDPLYTLVAFHSSFNVIGILLFYPLLGPFARLLERSFRHTETYAAAHVQAVPISETALYLRAIEADLHDLLDEIVHHNSQTLGIRQLIAADGIELPPADPLANGHARYAHIKDMQAEILRACIALQTTAMTPEMGERLNQLIAATRQAAHCVKSLKDLREDMGHLTEGEGHQEQQLRAALQQRMTGLYRTALALLPEQRSDVCFEALAGMQRDVRRIYDELWAMIRRILEENQTSDESAASLVNLNHELYSSNKALLETLEGLLLPESQAQDLDLLPG